jgi:hypothetical protein
MEILLWVIIIHIVELIGVGLFLLIKKNNTLEKIISKQNQYIETISYVTSQLNTSINELTKSTYVDADPELEKIFDDLKNLNNILEEISK